MAKGTPRGLWWAWIVSLALLGCHPTQPAAPSGLAERGAANADEPPSSEPSYWLFWYETGGEVETAACRVNAGGEVQWAGRARGRYAGWDSQLVELVAENREHSPTECGDADATERWDNRSVSLNARDIATSRTNRVYATDRSVSNPNASGVSELAVLGQLGPYVFLQNRVERYDCRAIHPTLESTFSVVDIRTGEPTEMLELLEPLPRQEAVDGLSEAAQQAHPEHDTRVDEGVATVAAWPKLDSEGNPRLARLVVGEVPYSVSDRRWSDHTVSLVMEGPAVPVPWAEYGRLPAPLLGVLRERTDFRGGQGHPWGVSRLRAHNATAAAIRTRFAR